MKRVWAWLTRRRYTSPAPVERPKRGHGYEYGMEPQ